MAKASSVLLSYFLATFWLLLSYFFMERKKNKELGKTSSLRYLYELLGRSMP